MFPFEVKKSTIYLLQLPTSSSLFVPFSKLLFGKFNEFYRRRQFFIQSNLLKNHLVSSFRQCRRRRLFKTNQSPAANTLSMSLTVWQHWVTLKFMSINFLKNLAQIFGDFLCNFKKYCFLCKNWCGCILGKYWTSFEQCDIWPHCLHYISLSLSLMVRHRLCIPTHNPCDFIQRLCKLVHVSIGTYLHIVHSWGMSIVSSVPKIGLYLVLMVL